MRNDIEYEYFEWLMDLSESLSPSQVSYRKLFEYLYSREFYSDVGNDDNRIEDGKNLRLRFAESNDSWTYRDIYLYLYNYPCSVLEMMVALAFRCEENIMGDYDIGDRTGVWFMTMLKSLHLNKMVDSSYNENHVAEIIDIFLNHEYEPNGDGGLFTLKNPPQDMRTAEIWYQLCWYLNEIDP